MKELSNQCWPPEISICVTSQRLFPVLGIVSPLVKVNLMIVKLFLSGQHMKEKGAACYKHKITIQFDMASKPMKLRIY